MGSLLDEPAVSIRVREHDEPGIEIRVNFGLFAGRHATPAEIDELAASLRESVEMFAILAEDRHEFGGDVEPALHQVVIEVPQENTDRNPPTCSRSRSSSPQTAGRIGIASRHGGGEL